ncbi:MAG: hypothetical protein V4696_05780 [Pseudomonadota bacterium]
MHFAFRCLLVVAALALPLSHSSATPLTTDVAPASGPLVIPFTPPVGEKIRYRWQKTDSKDGKSRLSWEIYDASFEKAGKGYRLTITPIDGGTDGKKSAAQIAFEKKLKELTKRPFIVEVSEDASISSVVDEARFWGDIERAMTTTVAGTPDQNERKAIQFVRAFFTDMSAEARTSLLIKDLQPLMEFAATDLEEAADILPFEFETTSAFNTKITMEGTVSVLGFDDDVAVFSLVSRLSPESLRKATAELLSKLPVDWEKMTEAQAAIDAVKHMRHENRNEYVVSRKDGMLLKFTSTEEVSVEAEGKTDHRITTKTLTRID